MVPEPGKGRDSSHVMTTFPHPPVPGPVSDGARQRGEHEVVVLLNRRDIASVDIASVGVTRHLVRWRGHTSA